MNQDNMLAMAINMREEKQYAENPLATREMYAVKSGSLFSQVIKRFTAMVSIALRPNIQQS